VRVPNLPIEGLDGHARAFGILSSFPPTACGLATLSAALTTGLAANDTQAGVVRVVDTDGQTQRQLAPNQQTATVDDAPVFPSSPRSTCP
jgi:hypothetical protein